MSITSRGSHNGRPVQATHIGIALRLLRVLLTHRHPQSQSGIILHTLSTLAAQTHPLEHAHIDVPKPSLVHPIIGLVPVDIVHPIQVQPGRSDEGRQVEVVQPEQVVIALVGVHPGRFVAERVLTSSEVS
jgi:hypothetical protein